MSTDPLSQAIANTQSTLAYLESLVPPAPSPSPAPTPTPVPVYLFDGRASQMTALQSYETTPGTLSTLVQKQSPTLWDGLAFLQNDVKLVADPHYGKIYDIVVNLGSHNPYYTPTDGRSSELSTRRPLVIGQWNWYANAYCIVAPWTQADWCTVDQFIYPSLSSPPLSVRAEKGQWSILQYAGQFVSGKPTFIKSTTLLPITTGQWLEIVVGVKPASDNSGAIQVHTRPQGGAWTKRIDTSGFPTTQWGTNGSVTIPASYVDGQGVPLSVIDHGGLYYGYYGAPPLPSPFPPNHVQRRGLSRHPSLQDALASLG